MNVLNAIPVIGWLIAAALCLAMSVPFYFLWNWLAPIYAYWLPQVYLALPFWHVFGLLWLLLSLRQLLLPGVSSTSKAEGKKND